MTQSGQGEEPSLRQAREGIVLPSDGGEPVLPGGPGGFAPAPAGPPGGHPAGPRTEPPAPGAPAGGQAWGAPWGPDQQSQAPQPGQGWAEPLTQQWDAPDQWDDRQQSAGGASQPLPPEGAPAAAYGYPPYSPPQPAAGAPLPPENPHAYGAPGTAYGSPAADEGATQYLPPVAAPGADGATQYIPPVPAADEGATQYIPPVAADEGATQYMPPVGAGTPPPAQYPGHAGHAGAASPSASEPTQYLPPVSGQAPGAPYGTQGGADRQPPAEFDNLFRSGPGGESAAGSTQQLPRFDQQQAPAPSYDRPSYSPPGHGGSGGRGDGGGRGGRGGRGGSRVPLIAAVGVGIVVLGVGAGALLGGGGDDDKAGKQTVSATAPATEGSASPSADPAKQQATALDGLLADSGNSRASVIAAVGDVRACNNLGQAASDLRAAAKQRNELVTRLSGLSVDKLPNHAELTTALTKAWQASASADDHYAAWADQVAGKKGCRKGQARTTGQTLAGNRASTTASAQKAKAAQLWNAIARTYGLTQRQPTQL
ncbi:hypothetical protein [Streptomyces sp. NPDC020996]|uniref:hypothetical protein n=1 Tax=Streptomyces sp. NPDC020996 TaxID=3154791 RepID=UPI0033CB63E2